MGVRDGPPHAAPALLDAIAEEGAGRGLRDSKPQELANTASAASTKTAWMGTYYDAKGVEHSVTGAKVMLPDGREVPQVKEYKYLGTPLKDEYKGRHDEMRKKVVRNCIGLIRQIGRVDILGPRHRLVKLWSWR